MQKIIAYLLVAFLATSCITYKDVDMKEFHEPKLEKFSKDEIRVRLTATVENPNGYKIKIKGANFDIFINGKEIGKAKSDRKIVLKKKSTDTYEVVIITSLKQAGGGIMAIAGSALLKGDIELRAVGSVKAGAFGFYKKMKIDEKKKLPVDKDMLKMFGM
jgi:LEA14-like dessication related protein